MVLYNHLQAHQYSYKEGMTWSLWVVTSREKNLHRVTNDCVINNKDYRGIHGIRNGKRFRTEWWGVSP